MKGRTKKKTEAKEKEEGVKEEALCKLCFGDASFPLLLSLFLCFFLLGFAVLLCAS
jgi:hypothetical protein